MPGSPEIGTRVVITGPTTALVSAWRWNGARK